MLKPEVIAKIQATPTPTPHDTPHWVVAHLLQDGRYLCWAIKEDTVPVFLAGDNVAGITNWNADSPEGADFEVRGADIIIPLTSRAWRSLVAAFIGQKIGFRQLKEAVQWG